jgi:hypothetical protein
VRQRLISLGLVVLCSCAGRVAVVAFPTSAAPTAPTNVAPLDKESPLPPLDVRFPSGLPMGTDRLQALARLRASIEASDQPRPDLLVAWASLELTRTGLFLEECETACNLLRSAACEEWRTSSQRFGCGLRSRPPHLRRQRADDSLARGSTGARRRVTRPIGSLVAGTWPRGIHPSGRRRLSCGSLERAHVESGAGDARVSERVDRRSFARVSVLVEIECVGGQRGGVAVIDAR